MDYCKRIFAFLLTLCLVIPMGLVSVSAAGTTVKYDFYDGSVDFGDNGKGIANALAAPNSTTLSANYDTNKFLPLADGSEKGYLYIYNPSIADNPAVSDGCLAINEMLEGDWIAVKFKNPGVGTYDVALRFYRTSNTKLEYSAYILPDSTSTADIESALTAANRYASGNQMYKGMGSNGDLNTVTLDEQLQVTSADGDFILVLQIDALTDNATKARMYIEGITLTAADGGASTPAPTTPVTPTTPEAPTTPATPTAPSGTEENTGYELFHSSLSGLAYDANGGVLLSRVQENLNSLYANGQMLANIYAVSSEANAYLNCQDADTSGNFGFSGLKLQKATLGDYVAIKFVSPGTGTYSISLNYYFLNANNSMVMNAYLLPGNSAAANIGALLTDENKIGSADVLSDTATKTTSTVRCTTGENLETGKEYILVLQAAKDNHNADDKRLDFMLTGLTFGEGLDSSGAAFDAISGEVYAESPIKSADFYRAATGVNPANGHDLLYLMLKGKTLYVYDMDTKQMIDKETNAFSTPMTMTFDADGNMWSCGAGDFFFKYDPTTGTGEKVTFGYALFDGTKTNAYGLHYAEDGNFYFAYWGYLGKYDPRTGEFTRISDQLTVDDKASDAQFAGYGGVIYRDGYLYLSISGDLNKDQIKTDKIIKYDIENRKIVQYIDVAESAFEASYGVANLNYADGILIGTFNNRQIPIYIDITGDEMVRLDALEGFDTCFINKLTGVVNGKIYAAGYVDNEASSRCLYEYDLATKTVKRLGNIVFLSSLQCVNGYATIDDEKLPGVSIVAPMNNSATGMIDLVFYNPRSEETVVWSGISAGEGTGMTLRDLITDPTGRYVITGAYGTNLLAFLDTQTGEVKNMVGYSHQTDSLYWYEDRLYVGNYNLGAVTRIDPETGDVEPLFNLMETVFQQKRMFALTAGDNKVFCGTVPDTGRTGGVLVWYDMETDLTYVAAGPDPEDVYYAKTTASFVVWRNVLTDEIEDFDEDGDSLYDYDYLLDDKGDEDPSNDVKKQRFYGFIENQCVNHILYKDGYIYGCTTKANGQNIEADYYEGNALIFVYDVAAMKVIATCDLSEHIQGLEDPSTNSISWIDIIEADPYEEGKFWGSVSDTLFSFTFDTETKTFAVTEELSLDKGNAYRHAGSSWHARFLEFDGDYMYVSFQNSGTYMINTSDPTDYTQISSLSATRLAQAADGNLYFWSNRVSNTQDVLTFKIADVAQPLVIQSVQDLIDALPETVTLENEAQIMSLQVMYNDLIESSKAQVNAEKLNAAVAALEPLQAGNVDSMIDAIGEVTLESEAAITAARNAYNALTEGAKAKVTKLPVLEAAEAKLAELKAAGPVDPEPAPNGDLTTIVIIAVAAVVLIAGAVTVLVLIRKKKQPKTEE